VAFHIGDRVCWIRAAKWKLKDTIGTIIKVLDAYPEPTYYVEFAFGVITLEASRITRVTDAAPPERNAEAALGRRAARPRVHASKSGMIVRMGKASGMRK
jgi:hypothetical protein